MRNLKRLLKKACKKAYNAEVKIIDWIFEAGELDFIPKDVVMEFTKNRFNSSLEMIGCEKIFKVDQELLKQTEWFDLEVTSETHTDFFWKTPTNYTKKAQSITAEDIF